MKRLTGFCLLLAAVTFTNASAQILTEWVETRQAATDDVIALGYPVPIPVDTPIPFDGFRTYAGLLARHQDLAASTAFVHPEVIGTTHRGRTIWAYRLGDNDQLTIDGRPEPATLTNGGIHAREWQSPEVVTGILELFALHESDQHFYDYLRDNVNMVVIPSLNIDGFMQTQRYPALNYMQIDPNFPNSGPRDGRMRRKNMLNADEDLYTTFDLLNGVDLNRNNAPFWASSPNSSSSGVHSIIHHGAAPASESETRALDAAAQLGPASKLRLFTDVHSFGQILLWPRSENIRLTTQNTSAMRLFKSHHLSFPAAKDYQVPGVGPANEGFGIGTTDEYFTYTYKVPAWTLEIEPSVGSPYHSPLPGNGADYGGVVENGHDGFILPESEVRRVREQVAESLAAVYFRQAGPPNIQSLRITDKASGAVVFDSGWDRFDQQSRELYSNQIQPLQLNHDYQIWLSFSKPMRWLENGQVADFPGRADGGTEVITKVLISETELNMTISDTEWLTEPGGAPDGYVNYRTDAYQMTVNFADDANNQTLVAGGAQASFNLFSADMSGMATDSNPGTIADWGGGQWTGYENNNGEETDFGGIDKQIKVQMTDAAAEPGFMVDVSMSTSWFDPSHNGEGWLLEILPDDVALVFWYSYDMQGNQDWYIGLGEVQGNSIVFPAMYQASGGEFGPGFDPDKIIRTTVGSASFIWTGCNEGSMSYQFGSARGRQSLSRITSLWGLPCPTPAEPPTPISDLARLSGPWFDRSHNGEGYNLAVLADGRVLVYWFSFDVDGNRRWFYGVGEDRNGVIVVDEMLTTSGGVFGPAFNPDDVVQTHWGRLELAIDCNGGTATYTSTEAGFGSGTLHVEKVTNLDSPVSCQTDP